MRGLKLKLFRGACSRTPSRGDRPWRAFIRTLLRQTLDPPQHLVALWAPRAPLLNALDTLIHYCPHRHFVLNQYDFYLRPPKISHTEKKIQGRLVSGLKSHPLTITIIIIIIGMKITFNRDTLTCQQLKRYRESRYYLVQPKTPEQAVKSIRK